MFFTLSNVLVDRASEDLFQYWEVFYASALTAAEDLIKFIFLVKEFKVKTTKKIKHRYSWRTKLYQTRWRNYFFYSQEGS